MSTSESNPVKNTEIKPDTEHPITQEVSEVPEAVEQSTSTDAPPAAEPTVEEPVTEPVTEPAVELVSEPIAEPASEPGSPPKNNTKRRTLFNPFGKVKKEENIKKEEHAKKEEPTKEEEHTKEVHTEEIVIVEEKVPEKKKSMFSFFGRSKSTARLEDLPMPPSNELATEQVSTGTDAVVIEATTPATPVEEGTTPVTSATDAPDTTLPIEVTEATTTDDAAVHADPAEAHTLDVEPNVKRQSFISKLFFKKKETKEDKHVTKEPTEQAVESESDHELHEEHAHNADVATASATIAPVDIVTEELVVPEDKVTARPSSPLGRLTGFLSKIPAKKEKKAKADVPATSTDEDTVPEDNAKVHEDDESVHEQPKEIHAPVSTAVAAA
ncbi:hypothetical protein PHYBLDRAFT_180569 [Phycomyces blakesleeanus NRRL 1555(-)]|uniref:Altered inheritance of mitochondria protein 21 n=1 Tax=Phycomyces blakesleeanus (strain ATCC 8743b / DSM 1359 / FGSC 10004 / NBRC 33097 / NRRL 1555) TaxID=763407 RepID=A0A167NLK5_PHYB8|nr:hypothetical protein PHYBLDRAFT_180569 [Phycomyces blakesleeanus NRRL 1555(-)]OAD76208.1 hypothetical protein PHYBLDRAFT_180569 [Phycomyces blakesleeanus NRRL 1555(-)]|eukprot:XP_018294248.1 hypothetical protein PHYBLDRAFT_180569 [Phycomyces blakesleeanus NRRL 1555(-)]